LWDGNRLAGEILPDGRQRAYVYHGARPYPLVIVERDVAGVPHVFYYHNDHRGCPELVTDEAGEVVWRANVDPFGNLLDAFEPDLDRFHQPLLLPGQYRDRETGLVYNLFRYYLPELTLFTSPDLLGNRVGAQLYAFADDLISQCDLFGLSPDDYDQSQRTPHRIVEINGVKYVEFDAMHGFTSASFVRPGGNGTEDHFASIGPNGEVVVMEGRHRAVAAAAGDPIPEHLGGISAHPGHLRYPLGEGGDFETTQNVGPSLLDLAMDPPTLAAARSGKKP
jgi:RHS repeat-associated protein